MSRVSIIGDGGWGTALAILLCSKGIDTVLWSVSSEYAQYLKKNRENVKFLKGVTLPDELDITSDVETAVASDIGVFVVPCEYLRSVLEKFKGAQFENIVSATKGIDKGSLNRPSEIISDYFDKSLISVISGPSIAYEVSRGIPTTVVMAGKGEGNLRMRDLFTSDTFRVYSSDDIVGVETGGALKNIIAIAAGVSDGLGFGTNSKAAILTRGLAEITRLGVGLGADHSTFRGLSGLGDLATTCISDKSRNRWFGEQIAKGRKMSDILDGTEMVVEGAATCVSARDLAGQLEVEMPITNKVYEVLYEDKDPALAVKELMTREPKHED